jgi:propanol-preferring alcohol dehydrogenase
MLALQLVGWRRAPELVEIPTPFPGPGEVLIRVGGAGICHSDLHLLYDYTESSSTWTPPFTLGHETAGWVEAHGAGVSEPELGTPVAVYGPWGCGLCRRCAIGAENYCERAGPRTPVGGLGRDGGMADFMVVPSSRLLVPLPESLTPQAAASLTDAGLTPYHAIARAQNRLGPGSTAVVIGAGGLGHVAVQILKATTPAVVVAVDARAASLELATASGADLALDVADQPVERVRALTGGRGADAVFDLVGTQKSLETAASLVGTDGHVGIVGAGGGTLPVSQRAIPFGVSVTPTYWGTRGELHDVLLLAATGHIAVQREHFPLSQALQAYDALRAGEITGRAVVVPEAGAA